MRTQMRLVPRAAAPLAALIASGFALIPFSVYGFAPSGAKARESWLADVALIPHTFSFFEAPHRIVETLRASASLFGDRPICVARELTKLHQEFIRGTASHLADILTEPRGEFTIVVGPADNSMLDSDILLTDAEIVKRFWQSTESGQATRRQIVTMLARQSGRTAKDVYAVIELAKKSGIQP